MRDLKGSKVLVTGAGGFLARHLVPKLVAQGAEVTGIDLASGVENARGFKSKAKLVEADITDYASIERVADRFDYVMHLAAIAAPIECEKRPEKAFLVNVQGTFNVLKLAQKRGARKFIFSCYDAQTRVMTKSGLKGYESVQQGDEVLSVNPNTREIQWKKITGLNFYHYNGNMVHFKGRSVDLLVTPNHKMLIDFHTTSGWRTTFEEASSVAQRSTFKYLDGWWEGCPGKLLDKEFYLLGLYIGDGYTYHGLQTVTTGLQREEWLVRARGSKGNFVALEGYAPAVTRDKAPRTYLCIPPADKSRKKVESTLDELGIKWNNDSRKNIYFNSQKFVSLFRSCGSHAIEKHVPREILESQPQRLRFLLQGLLDSDGNRKNMFTTVSEQLAIDIVEIITKLGGSATIKKEKAKKVFIKDHWANSKTCYRVSLKFRPKWSIRTSSKVRSERYDGVIWCPEVEDNHNLLVERNGKFMFCGNSSAHVYGISPKYMPTDEKHPLALQDTYCYDDQTEVLTDVGWKKFVDLSGSEQVMQLNPSNGQGEMVTPSLFYKKHYDGPMYLYEGKMNFCVTPNHNFWYVAYPKYWASREASFKLAPIEAMLNHNRVVVSSGVVWNGEEPRDFVLEEYVAMRGRGHRQVYSVQARKFPMATWLRFLGWYVAEGSTDRGRYARITQKKPENTEEIRDTIKALGWEAYRGITGVQRDATLFTIGSAQLVRWLHANCYVDETESSYTKKVPEFIKKLSPRLLEGFLDAYCHGDGTLRTRRFGRSWTTYSQQLSDDIQELVLKAGGVASVSQGYDKKLGVPYWRVYERLRKVLQIKCRNIKSVNYSGMVACVEVPSHILMVRRGGKTMWCGNTTTKILGESLCQLFYSNHNLEYVTSRLYNAYGPGQNEDYFIPAMISKAKTGRIELRGRAVTKDFVFVEDVADAFVKALTSDFVGEVNIGSGKQTTLEFVADHIAKALRAKLTFSNVEPAGPSHMQCDTERARRILGWEAKTSIEQGLDRTLAASK